MSQSPRDRLPRRTFLTRSPTANRRGLMLVGLQPTPRLPPALAGGRQARNPQMEPASAGLPGKALTIFRGILQRIDLLLDRTARSPAEAGLSGWSCPATTS
jgi:hypothetical protein